MSEFVLVRADGWEGLYVDGHLVTENHSINPRLIINAAGGTTIYLTEAQDKALGDRGRLPTLLADLETM